MQDCLNIASNLKSNNQRTLITSCMCGERKMILCGTKTLEKNRNCTSLVHRMRKSFHEDLKHAAVRSTDVPYVYSPMRPENYRQIAKKTTCLPRLPPVYATDHKDTHAGIVSMVKRKINGNAARHFLHLLYFPCWLRGCKAPNLGNSMCAADWRMLHYNRLRKVSKYSTCEKLHTNCYEKLLSVQASQRHFQLILYMYSVFYTALSLTFGGCLQLCENLRLLMTKFFWLTPSQK